MISGVIITYNEEKHIKECIESLKLIADDIIVVDSFSTDNTKLICESLDVTFIENRFEGHIQQKNFAMEKAKYDIILSLDADERISEAMIQSIEDIKDSLKGQAYSFNRLNNYCGKWLKWSWYPDRKVRLWDRAIGQWGGENPHDKVLLKDNIKPKRLKGDILHYAYDSVAEHLLQIHKFSQIAAKGKRISSNKLSLLFKIVFSPLVGFIRRYLLNFGFLDGYYGLVYCYMASYLSYLKYYNTWYLLTIKDEI